MTLAATRTNDRRIAKHRDAVALPKAAPAQDALVNCPHCNGIALVMSDRQGIEIDYCPQCRGVWLDRGELDKIIERSRAQSPPPILSAVNPHSHHYPKQGHEPSGHYHGKKRKREGFLSDLFDF